MSSQLLEEIPPRSFRIDEMEPYLLGALSEQIQAKRQSGEDVIDLSKLNPSYGAPHVAVESLIQAALKPYHHRYSSSPGIRRLREVVSAWYEKQYSENFSPESEIVVTFGIKEGLSHLLLSMISPGETVLLPTPSYPIHRAAVFIAGGRCVDLPFFTGEEKETRVLTDKSEEFFFQLKQQLYNTTPRPRVLLLSFPHNPTTTVVTPSFFKRLIEFALSENLFVIHDFAYAGFTYNQYQAPSILQIKGARQTAVEFFSLSKAYAMPGWRVGFCLGNEGAISRLKKIKSYVDFGIFQPIQIAALKVLSGTNDFFKEHVQSYQLRRDLFCDELSDRGWKIHKPQALPFVWVEIPESFREGGSVAFSKQLLELGNVAVSPGIGFGERGEGYLRFSLCETEKRLSAAVEVMSRITEQ